MRIVRCIMLVLIFGGTLNAQSTVNNLNAEGKRTGAWEKFYDNGSLRYKGQFEDGKEMGVFKFYKEDASEHPSIIKEFIAHSTVSKVKFFTVDGVLQSSGEFDGKNRVGKWVFYYSDGSKSSEENYVKGQLSGTYKMYYKNGVLAEFTHFKAGKLEGVANYYNLKGSLLGTGQFSDNEKIGEWEYFENGDPSKKSLGKY